MIILELKKYLSIQLIPYLLWYVPDKYRSQQICDKAIMENGGALKSVSNCCKNQEICIRTFDNYHHGLEFVTECYKIYNAIILYVQEIKSS